MGGDWRDLTRHSSHLYSFLRITSLSNCGEQRQKVLGRVARDYVSIRVDETHLQGVIRAASGSPT
jgi:hypothetical protein